MKTYKGFNPDMTCRTFKYKQGEEYETDTAVCCRSGFHACEMPLDCFKYYQPSKSIYCEVEQKTGTPVEPQAAPNADSNPKGRAFSGWKDEPKIMPNKDSVIVGSLKYLRTYKAEGTTDVLYSDSLFYGYEVRHPDNDLKKDGLSYTIIKPFETMPAKDSILYVSYSLTTAPTPSSGLIFNNANQDLISKGSSKTGTLKYSLDKITFVETKPTGKNAKEYTVYFRVDGVTEHYNTEPDSIVGITIAPKPIEKLTITLKENENGYTYNGYPHKPEVKSVSTRINNTETEIPKDEYAKMMKAQLDSVSNMMTALMRVKRGPI